MNRSPRFQVLVAMSSRSPLQFRGGRSHRRGFSDRPHDGGRGTLVSGDSHFRSVRDANLGFRQGTFSNQTAFQPPPYNQNQQFRQPPPPYNQNQQFRQSPPYNQNQQFRQPPPYNQNQQFRPPPPYNPNQRFRRPPPPFDQNQAVRPRPRPSKPLDYRNWEYTKEAPSPNSERFVVLSYNILADYLAISHRSKLYFHIPRYMLDWEWRKKNILFELGLWSADIMCFQEVDRFQDLEEELKLRGYSGIWKMRTGNAIDGCAIFWRASRFKLLYEEGIEFNKLGLRDNVAQICVLELLSRNCTDNTTAPQSTSECPNKVVICNIHVLFNPRRGEIKLGQVRTLLEKAHAVSKIWNYAPVVLCGDFNCTPKSPLYNFISEQKLDLSAVDRDKVSGQASAEIRAPPPKPYPRVQVDGSIQVPSVVGSEEVGIKPSDPLSDNLKHNKDGNAEVFPSVNSSSQSHCNDTVLGVSDKAGRRMQCANKDSGVIDEVMKESQQSVVDGSEGETSATFFIPTDSLKDSSSCFQSEGRFPSYQGQIYDEKHKFSPPGVSHSKDESEVTEMTQGDKVNTSSHLNNGSISDHSDLIAITENESTNCDDFTLSLSNDHPSNVECNPDVIGSSQFPSTKLSSTPYPDEIPSTSTSTDFVLADKLGNLSLGELDEIRTEGESADKDNNTFVSTLHDMEDAFQSDFDQFVTSNLDHTSKDLGDYVYDPSLWTPMEIATATGNADQTFLEHPLQLRSTYAEAEDCSGTRDSNGEPMVTSYSRCFMGTVDYIWHSEGLQTVRVLAPIPKHAMQWTPGYPTKKWGSDHIALASEVAFVETNR